MKVLVACEFSGVVRRAFRKRGHDAWSCDLLPAEDGSPFHIQGDVLPHLDDGWDLMIGHPTCTYLTNSGVQWLHTKPGRWDLMKQGVEFFLKLWNAPIPRIALENPIMHGYAKDLIGEATQHLQPWMFGDGESKGVSLWLKNLPPLQRTHQNGDLFCEDEPSEIIHRVHRMAPGPNRSKERSRFFPGIAGAMAQQWGDSIETRRNLKPKIALSLR